MSKSEKPKPQSLAAGLNNISMSNEVAHNIAGLIPFGELLSQVRRYTMARSRVEIPVMSLGVKVLETKELKSVKDEPLPVNDKLVAANAALPRTPEGQPQFHSLTLISSKLVYPLEVPNKLGEPRSQEEVVEYMVTRAAENLEDLALNGDESSRDDLYVANDGFIKLGGPQRHILKRKQKKSPIVKLQTAARALPAKYRRDMKLLRFYVDYDFYNDYVSGLIGDTRVDPSSIKDVKYLGAPVVPLRYMPKGTIILTNPDNLILGVEKDGVVRKTSEGYLAMERDSVFYALHLRVDFGIQNREAIEVATFTTRGEIFATRVTDWVKRDIARLNSLRRVLPKRGTNG